MSRSFTRTWSWNHLRSLDGVIRSARHAWIAAPAMHVCQRKLSKESDHVRSMFRPDQSNSNVPRRKPNGSESPKPKYAKRCAPRRPARALCARWHVPQSAHGKMEPECAGPGVLVTKDLVCARERTLLLYDSRPTAARPLARLPDRARGNEPSPQRSPSVPPADLPPAVSCRLPSPSRTP